MNVLALVELIRHSKNPHADADLEQALWEVASGLGFTADQIEDALYSDRMLVIYEP